MNNSAQKEQSTQNRITSLHKIESQVFMQHIPEIISIPQASLRQYRKIPPKDKFSLQFSKAKEWRSNSRQCTFVLKTV